MKDSVYVKKNNIKKCLAHIWNNEEVTKPQLAVMSSLTAVTAHKYINELVTIGLLKESGHQQTLVGKKAAIYKLNPHYGCFIGINLYNQEMTVSLFDFNINCLYSKKESFPGSYSEDAFDCLCRAIRHVMKKTRNTILGMGITLSGQIDFSNGIVTNCIDMNGWHRIPLKAKLEEKFNIMTVVENDVMACALALKWLRTPSANSVLVHISKGVGIGVIIDNEIYRGKNSYAGELGHATVSVEGKLCRCGNKGCIEEFVSDECILSKTGCTDMRQVVNAVRGNDAAVVGIVNDACAYIAILLDYVIKAYDPDIIYLFSSWLNDLPLMFGRITDLVFLKSKWLSRDALRIVLHDRQSEPLLTVKGPAFAVFDYYINHGSYMDYKTM